MSGTGWNQHSFSLPDTHIAHHLCDRHTNIESSDDETNFMPNMSLNIRDYSIRGGSTLLCTKENLPNSIGYVNQELQLLGLSCLQFDGTKCTSDIVFFINSIHDLLTLYHKTKTIKEDLENRNHRLTCEVDHHKTTHLRVSRLQEQTDKELDQEREKFRQLNQKYKQVSNKWKSEKEDVKRLTAVIHSRDLQHKHEQKKKEREVQRLKDRLNQLLSDKAPDRKVGMDLRNVVGRNEGRRATWKSGSGKQEEEMYHLLINNYEDRHRELMQENGELRDCLLSLQRELSALLKRTGDMSTAPFIELPSDDGQSLSSDDEDLEEHSVMSRLSITDLDEGYFQMPYDIIRQEIERTFKETCNQISESMKRSLIRNITKGHPSITLSKMAASSTPDSSDRRSSTQSSDSSEVDKLKKQIHSYKAIIQQQEELIQQSLHSQTQSVENSFLHESQLLKEKESLSEQKKLFFEEKANFEKERKAFTEAAIRLGKERQTLQEERAKILKQHFLNISPFKENKKSRGDVHSTRLLPATPVFSPAKSSWMTTEVSDFPTTAELYNLLGLSPSVVKPDSIPRPKISHQDSNSSTGSITFKSHDQSSASSSSKAPTSNSSSTQG
ncbi:unnamed protein product [Lymnaea stagnalis]|uniref:Uncharacterized protein n=1 Tax=Lymnaea stagnalis TaxID=6523 RepID=A0AAV2IIR1_LYMST